MIRTGDRSPANQIGRFSVSFLLLAALIALLTLAGGASRAEVAGQSIVRAGAAIGIAIWLLVERPPLPTARIPLTIVLAAIGLVALQLIPLPPAIWTALPGRAIYQDASALTNAPLPWRPLAIVPSAALNALFSLIAPLAAVLFAGGCRAEERRMMLIAILAAIGISAFVELAQLAGTDLANPFVAPRKGQPSGMLANRNHQALLLAIGCAAIPVWAALRGRAAAWRPWAALGCVVLLLLLIVASGSRAGLVLGALAVMSVPFILKLRIGSLGQQSGRRNLLLIAMAVGAVLSLAALAFWAGRSESLDRLRDIDTGADMRTRGLPVVLGLVREHWLIGSGFGSFDPLFRAVEPFSLLKPTFFNHAHNDLLEIAMNGGLPAIALLIGALGWVTIRTVRLWSQRDPFGRLAAVIVLLVLLASIVDYPARTPLIMALLAIAGVWLAGTPRPADHSTLTRP